jgi:hypothetical protein
MRTPAGGPGRGDSTVQDAAQDSSRPRPSQALRCDLRFRRLVEHLHQLGPRLVGELLLAAERGIEDEILARLERYGRLDPAMVATIEARDWPPPPIRVAA